MLTSFEQNQTAADDIHASPRRQSPKRAPFFARETAEDSIALNLCRNKAKRKKIYRMGKKQLTFLHDYINDEKKWALFTLNFGHDSQNS